MSLATSNLKLLSYNVQVGIPTSRYRHYITKSWKHVLPFPDRKSNLDRIAEVISHYDIVGLQELDAGSLRSEFIHQPEYVAKKSGLPYCYSRINRDLGFVAQNSLALLSRHEAHFVKEHSLPSKIPGRGALEAHFGDPDDPLVVVIAHLSLSAKARCNQLRYIATVVKGYGNVVVMGDLNSELHSREIKHFFETTALEAPKAPKLTYPSWNPRLAFDHIFVTPQLKTSEPEVLRFKHSDHLPISTVVNYSPVIREPAAPSIAGLTG
ncbi:MAG: endonuclease/exonuclease/phosphatase family protein [Thiotrichales bacterium]